MEDTDRRSQSELDNSENSDSSNNKAKESLPPYEGNDGTADVPIEDMNATMMTIDSQKLLEEETRQKIELEVTPKPTDAEIIQEQLENKKSSLHKLFSKLGQVFKKSKTSPAKEASSLSSKMLQFEGVWIAPSELSLVSKITFYMIRFLIVATGVFSQMILIQGVLQASRNEHPLTLYFVVAIVVEVLLCVLALWRKASASWFFTIPVTVLTLIFSLAAWQYHLADLEFFTVLGFSIYNSLTVFYLVIFIYIFILTFQSIAISYMAKIIWAAISILCALVVGLNFIEGTEIAGRFWVSDISKNITLDFLKPTAILFQILLPLLFIFVLIKSFWKANSIVKKVQRGFCRSLVILFLALIGLGLGIMQNQRVYHVGNMILPMRLDAAQAEWMSSGHHILLRTQNTTANSDEHFRYQIDIESNTQNDEAILKISDLYNLKIANLQKSDFKVWIDGKAHSDFQFIANPKAKNQVGNYFFKVNLNKKEELLTWNNQKSSYLAHEKLEFQINQFENLDKIQIRELGVVLFESDEAIAKLEWPLSYVGEGEHNLELVAVYKDSQVVEKLPVAIKVIRPQEFLILSPIEMDSVGANFEVELHLVGLESQNINKVTYKIADQILLETQSFLPSVSLDLSEFPNQNLRLLVEVQTKEKTFQKQVQVAKQNDSPTRFLIQSPAQGSFVNDQVKIAYELDGNAPQRVLGIKVHVNGNAYENFEVAENSFTLPVEKWRDHNLFVSVQATLENGAKISDWVQLRRGVALLDLRFKNQTLKFLNRSSLTVLFDASVSQVDFWMGRIKWQAFQDAWFSNDIQNRLSAKKTNLMVMGSKDPFYYNNCKDVVSFSSNLAKSKAAFRKRLKELNPKGLSAYPEGLLKAIKKDSSKILLFTDGNSPCSTRQMRTFSRKLGTHDTELSVFVLGEMSDKEKNLLQKVSEDSGGKFHQPKSYKEFVDSFAEELDVYFEIYKDNKRIHKASFADQSLRLAPGDYKFKFSISGKAQELDIKLEQGLKKVLDFSGKNSKIVVDEKDESL